jgi:3-deoxy-7-phosphoheptulonate synthase
MALAAKAAGADGLIVEMHPDPSVALCDGPQALTFAMLQDLSRRLAVMDKAIG